MKLCIEKNTGQVIIQKPAFLTFEKYFVSKNVNLAWKPFL